MYVRMYVCMHVTKTMNSPTLLYQLIMPASFLNATALLSPNTKTTPVTIAMAITPVTILGHVHAYERSYPVYQNEPTSTDYVAPSAPVYILQGASGNREGNKGSYPPQEELPSYSANTQTAVGYALLTVGPEQLDWVFYAAPDPENGVEKSVLDSVTIAKP